MIYTDRQWQDFLRVSGAPEMDLDPRLAGLNARSRNAQTVFDTISGITCRHSSEYWVSTLRSAGLTAVPMRSIDDLVSDPHLSDVGQFAEVRQSSEGQLRLLRLPGEWEGWKPVIGRPPPELGEHTQEILGATEPFAS
jgi:formyl-CoA transferase